LSIAASGNDEFTTETQRTQRILKRGFDGAATAASKPYAPMLYNGAASQ
jgi:hypothetical protein